MHDRPTVLLAGFTPDAQHAVSDFLAKHNNVLDASTLRAAWDVLGERSVDLVLTRHVSGTADAIEFLREMRVEFPNVVRVLGGKLTHAEMIAAINDAAIYQFLPDGWSPEQTELLVRRALETRELAYRHRHLSRELKFADNVLQRLETSIREELRERYQFDRLIYISAAMVEVTSLARKAAATDLPVLIQGESGTGKELLARAVHYNGDRRDRPFLVQDCSGASDSTVQSELFGHVRGALAGAVGERPGLLEHAEGGTLFLENVARLSPMLQARLLHLMEDGEFTPVGAELAVQSNVRVIAATDTPLDRAADTGTFRRDLYDRVNGFQLNVPPLRERTDDIPVLAEFLARRYGDSIGRRILGISPALERKLSAYDWPGNVREVDNEVKRMVALASSGELLSTDRLSAHIAHFAPPLRSCTNCLVIGPQPLKEKVGALESALVADALHRHHWNQRKAAAELGLSRVGIANKIKRYGLRDDAGPATN